MGRGGAQGAQTRPFTGIEHTVWPENGTITEGGAYTIPSTFHGTITISNLAAAPGVKLSSEGPLTNVNIVVDDTATGADLWIEGLSITNSTDGSIIQFNGSNNTLTLLGNSVLTQNALASEAVIDMGDGLTVQGNGSALTVNNMAVNPTMSSAGSTGACIGTDSGERTSGNLMVINATLTLNAFDGAGLGAGGSAGAVGDIIIENSTINTTGHFYSGIGSGRDDSECGDITVRQSSINNLNATSSQLEDETVQANNAGSIDTCIGSGYDGSRCGNITIDSSIINASNRDSPLVGAGNDSICQDIIVMNSDIIGYSTYGAGIGSGVRGIAGGYYDKKCYEGAT